MASPRGRCPAWRIWRSRRFADVDQFDSKEVIANRVSKGVLPESARVEGAGVPHQNRNYFWYARTLSR